MARNAFTLLIVDDTRLNVDLLVNLLEKEGYRTLTAENGEKALDLIREKMPDLILLDISMPGMDGLTVCRTIKKEPRLASIPVIFITAHTDEADVVAGFDAGGNDYITKPFAVPELKVRVRTQLALKQAQEELRKSAEKFHDLAIHDDLTGLYNTRYLYQTLALEIKICKANNTPLSLLFMDIDNFKHVVDNYGHLNGSEAIAEVASTIQELIQDPGFCVSYGGDEFVVVLPGITKEQAMEKAEQIRFEIAGSTYLAERGLQIHLTVSCGVATFPDDGEDITSVLSLADNSLFAVKAAGKNNVGNGLKVVAVP